MSSTRHRQPSPDTRSFIKPLSSALAKLSVNDADTHTHLLKPESAARLTKHPADRSTDPSSKAYYESKRSSRAGGDTLVEIKPFSSKRRTSSSAQRTSSRSNYIIKPRTRTSSESGGRRALNLFLGNGKTSTGASYTNSKSRTPQTYYQPQDDGDYYIIPASSSRSKHHRRRYSNDEKGSRVVVKDKEKDSKSRKKEYHPSGGESRKKRSPVVTSGSSPDIDLVDSYSYTNPTEQFYRDSDHIQDYRRRSERPKHRPLSMSILEPYSPVVRQEPRPAGPPPTTRGLDKLSAEKKLSPTIHNSPEAAWDPKPASRRMPQASVRRPDGDAVASRGEYDELAGSRYRMRRDEDGTVVVEAPFHPATERPKYPPQVADRREPPVSVPTAALHPGAPRDVHPREVPIDTGNLERRQSYERKRPPRRPASDSGRESTGEEYDDEYDEYDDDDSHRNRPYHIEGRPRRTDSPESYDGHRERQTQRNTVEASKYVHPATQPDTTMAKISPTGSGCSNNSTRDRASVAVYNHPAEPDNRQKRLEAPQPKSILKQPTPKFPEDPNAPREGVAPLKDATKKGIPPGARWTKIDRRLVSPAALEGQERFEERPDYVIVLRVLNKEEIRDYAIRTAKIRAARYASGRSDKQLRLPEKRDYDDSDALLDDDDDDDDDYEDTKERLAIEASPDPRYDAPRSRA